MSPVRKNSATVSRVVKIGAVVVVLCLGVWGCARKPAARVGDALESKAAKLEQDLRTTSHARDKARKDLAALEAESARLQLEAKQKLEAANKLLAVRTNERDDLRRQVVQRIAERDTFHTRVEKLRKGMQQLMAQDEAAEAAPGTPGGSSTPAASNAGPSLGGNS